jgi:hypothetical protein
MAAKRKKQEYMGNPNLPTADAVFEYTPEMVMEIEKCKESLLYFGSNYFYIIDPDEGKKVIPLFEYQERLLTAFEDHRQNIVLSSRQSGKTTVATILALHEACFKDHKNIVIVANKEETAKNIYKRVRLAYLELPNWLKPGIKKWGDTGMELANGSTIEISTTTGNAARGKTINCVNGDSVVKIRNKITGEISEITFSDLHRKMRGNNTIKTILIQ